LRSELTDLLFERHRVSEQGLEDQKSDLTQVSARIAELEARIATAHVVDPAKQPHDEVRFGAKTVVRSASGEERSYQIVGVDEADATAGRVAFVAPIARALLGRRVGDVAVVRSPRADEELELLSISYPI
ncbi:MAG TPA: GreA/GreB family elongation factor, partial [Polyangiaceae bacterium]